MKLILENVRGFAGEHTVNFRPLTILVGENSSGKTTILSSLAATLSARLDGFEIPFNRPPFEMGGFESIATYRGGKFGRSEKFSIGLELDGGVGAVRYTYVNNRGSPRLAFVRASVPNKYGIQIDLLNGKCILQSLSKTAKNRWIEEFNVDFSEDFLRSGRSILSLLVMSLKKKSGKQEIYTKFTEALYGSLFEIMGEIPVFQALAPLRSKPRRTYDELIDEVKPEGDHVPLVLARAIRDNNADSEFLISNLTKFGQNSGLFEKINVKRMGRAESDPFQIRVKLNGPDANLTDVGYGVSQALPIVIDSLSAKSGSVVLVQQPEVHLHPRAQAELGDFFADMVANHSKKFIIETHSDYLIDRVRIAVAKGVLKPEDVQLVYLQRKKLDVNVHHLSVGSQGDVLNAPDGYRSFFLEEEYKIMTRGV